jgi:hypothetical protein
MFVARTTNIESKRRHSETADYLAACIARDRPDILIRMKAGEYPSVREAAIQAGLSRPSSASPSIPRASESLQRGEDYEGARPRIVTMG